MFRLFCLLLGYAFGCIQTAYFTGRLMAKIDIREHGSGNAGMTNAFRVLGRSAGLFVFIIDCLKAITAYTLAAWLFKGSGSFFAAASDNLGVLPGLYAGLGTVLGHNFPFFLKFKGGKGIAATLGTMLVLDWRSALIIYAAGALSVGLTWFISLASLLMTLLMPILWWWFGYGTEATIIGVLLAAMAWFMHRGNIQRLLTGTERKFSLKRQKPEIKP